MLLSADDSSDGDGPRHHMSLLSINGMDECTNSCEGPDIEGYVVGKIGEVNRHCTKDVQEYTFEVKWGGNGGKGKVGEGRGKVRIRRQVN